MSVDYKKLFKLMYKKGYSINSLKEKGIVTDFSGRKIRNNQPVDLSIIASICEFFDVPIEDVVEIRRRSDQ